MTENNGALWALVIQTPEATLDITLHRSESGAKRKLAEFARDYWEDTDIPDMPLDLEELIEVYFSADSIRDAGECYQIERVEVEA